LSRPARQVVRVLAVLVAGLLLRALANTSDMLPANKPDLLPANTPRMLPVIQLTQPPPRSKQRVRKRLVWVPRRRGLLAAMWDTLWHALLLLLVAARALWRCGTALLG